MRQPLRNERHGQLLVAIVAALGYGGWAFYSNMMVDAHIALRAALIQGGYSGLLTLVTVVMLEALFLRLNDHLSCRANIIVTLLLVLIAQYSVIVPVHLFNGTPNILVTLLPGFIIGGTFSAAYLFSVKNRYYPQQ